MDTVGLIGLGNMGSGMAGNLIKAGYPLVVHDLRPDVVGDFAARGARGSRVRGRGRAPRRRDAHVLARTA